MSLTERQLAMRRTGITGTDMVALVGLSPNRTRHDVFCDKMGISKPVDENEAMSLGSELEPIILRRLAERRGLVWMLVEPDALTMRHPDFAHHVATPDALFAHSEGSAPDAIGQAKATGFWPGKEWGPDDDHDSIPEKVLVQCAWEMWVSRKDIEYVAALNGVTQLRTYRITIDQVADIILAERELADQFWTDYVLTGKSPPLDASDGSARMLAAMFPKNNGVMLQAGPELEALAAEYFEARNAEKVAEGRRKQAQHAITAQLGPADGANGDGWRVFLKERAATTYMVTKDGYRHFDIRETKR